MSATWTTLLASCRPVSYTHLLISVNTSKVAAVDTDEAITFGQEVFASGRTQGYSHSYRYTVVESDEGIRIIFLDCWRSLSNLRFFVGIGVLVFVPVSYTHLSPCRIFCMGVFLYPY